MAGPCRSRRGSRPDEISPQHAVGRLLRQNNPLPESGESGREIATPIEDEFGDWQVNDHSAEKYKHMRLRGGRVAVGRCLAGPGGCDDVELDCDRPCDTSTCLLCDPLRSQARSPLVESRDEFGVAILDKFGGSHRIMNYGR
jgi:hypothetical protein